MKISGKSFDTRDVFEDYGTRPVPGEKRFGWLIQGMVWSGVAFCLAMFSVGGMLASSMSFTSFIIAVFAGAAIVTVIGSLTGSIGARTHLASAFNSRFTLGVSGGRIFGVILAVSLFGWFGYQCYYFALSVITALRMFGFSGGSPAFWAVVDGLLMMITAIVGFHGITLLSNLGVPLLFLLLLTAVRITAGQADFALLKTVSERAAGGMSMSGGIVIVVGSFITGACIVSDLSRFSKKPKDGACGCILGYMIVYPILLLSGGFFYYAYGTSDLCEVFITHCGLGILVPFVLVISTWTTNGYNLYCSILGICNALDGHVKLPRWRITLTAGTIFTLLGALGIMETFTFFLNLLGVLIPPVAAVIIADYYLYNYNSGLYAYESMDKLKKFRVNTCLSAIVGIAVGLLCNYADIGVLVRLCSVFPACIVAMLASVATLVIYNTVTHSGTE